MSMEQLMKAMGGGGGAEQMAALAENLKSNPMLQDAFSGNEEMQNLLNNPEELAKKVAEMQELMNSDEGQAASKKIMEEVQSVLTDPEKMRMGLEQFATNPMLKGMADAVPELKEVRAAAEQQSLHSRRAAKTTRPDPLTAPTAPRLRTRKSCGLLSACGPRRCSPTRRSWRRASRRRRRCFLGWVVAKAWMATRCRRASHGHAVLHRDPLSRPARALPRALTS